MDIIIAIAVSAIVSSAATVLILLLNSKSKYVGTLVIDRSEPNEPLPFIEINKGVGGIEGVANCGYVTLKVENRNYLPQD
jgi:hypothetical protein